MGDPCANGCNGCDECTDYDDEPEDQCLHCRGDGMDPDCDYLMPCPECCPGHYRRAQPPQEA